MDYQGDQNGQFSYTVNITPPQSQNIHSQLNTQQLSRYSSNLKTGDSSNKLGWEPTNHQASSFEPKHNYSPVSKTANISTVRSMVFSKESSSKQASKLGGLTKLESMARKTTGNFDDSKYAETVNPNWQSNSSPSDFQNSALSKPSFLQASPYSQQSVHHSFIASDSDKAKPQKNFSDFLQKFKAENQEWKKKFAENEKTLSSHKSENKADSKAFFNKYSEANLHGSVQSNHPPSFQNLSIHKTGSETEQLKETSKFKAFKPITKFAERLPKKQFLQGNSYKSHQSKLEKVDSASTAVSSANATSLREEKIDSFLNITLNSTQENTPVKPSVAKPYVKPSFFKKKMTFQEQQPRNTENLEIPVIKATLSDSGSNSSFEYIKEDSIKEGKKWKLEDFELGDKLGKGAFGDVYMARELQAGFLCVLKKMSKKRIRDSKREEQVIRQLKIQMHLSHHSLTSLYGFFDDEEFIYLIMESLPDGNLAQIKRNKKSSEQETAKLLKQLCEGLSYMHRKNIIHRDLKPENIFVNEGSIKLGDFGCSVMTNTLRNTVTSCLEYSSPEQLTQGSYNEKIDVWSIGILAFELLTGKSPFGQQMFSMVQNGGDVNFSDVKFPEALNLSVHAKDFISSLLNVDPIERMDIDEALEHQFITRNALQSSLKLDFQL